MRKSNFILAGIVALAVGFTGCNNEDYDMPQGSPKAGTPVSFSAEYDSEFKKLVYGDTENNLTELKWVAGDKVVIYSPSSEVGANVSQMGIYSAKSSASSTDFEYSETAGSYQSITWAEAATQSFYSLYPGDMGIKAIFVSNQLAVTIPAAPNYATSGTNGMENVLMYATAPNVNIAENEYIALNYNHIPTVLEVELPGNSKVITSIEVTATGADANKIAGSFTATVGNADANNPIKTAFWNAQSTTGKSDKITVTPPANFKNGKLYIAVAPYAFTSLTVKFIAEGHTAEIASTNAITARKLYKVTKSGDLDWQSTTVTPPVDVAGTPTARTSANSVDMGIRVVSSINSETGLVLTTWIGRADGTKGWALDGETGVVSNFNANAIPANAKPLYFARGNMHISSSVTNANIAAGHWGHIESIANATAIGTVDGSEGSYGYSTKNHGVFRWGDANVTNAIISGLSTDAVPNLSGDARYDIARKQLGNAWRLPTGIEWAFLMEEVAPTGNVVNSWSSDGYNSYYTGVNATRATMTTGFNSSTGVLTLISDVSGYKNSLYLPAAGYGNSTSEFSNRGTRGYYWSGSKNTLTNVRAFLFLSDVIGGYCQVGNFGLTLHAAVRPVSE